MATKQTIPQIWQQLPLHGQTTTMLRIVMLKLQQVKLLSSQAWMTATI